MVKRRWVGWTVTGVTLGVVAVGIGARMVRANDANEADGLVDRLDYVFQQRFQNTEGNIFGISRIPVTPEHRNVVHWRPDQEMEKKVAADLKQRGLAAAYLLARPQMAHYVLAQPEEQRQKPPYSLVPTGRNGISKPIVLSTGDTPVPLPTQAELLKGIDQAEAAFKNGDQSEFGVRDWRIIAKPVRATADCIKCHERRRGDKNLQVGAVLGVAMYAFTPEQKKAAQAAP
jgi:hypothetical protein